MDVDEEENRAIWVSVKCKWSEDFHISENLPV
jgi:hypothetical protein